MTRGGRRALGACLVVAAAAAGCGIAVRSELVGVQPQKLLFDDACELQDYFDTIAAGQAKAPDVVATNELESTEGKRAAGGRTRFRFESDFQLRSVRRLLEKHWTRVPDEVLEKKPVEIEVLWAEKAGVRRVVTNREAELGVGDDQWALPYHPCLSDLLFGARLYATRREVLGLPPIVAPPPVAPNAAPVRPRDAGADVTPGPGGS